VIKTKIIATLGSASQSVEKRYKLILMGVVVFIFEGINGAAGIITEYSGITSDAANEKGIPVIAGVKDATRKPVSGKIAIMNCQHRQIYQAK
jgi:phosphohistidine swiveling domain-containing protein